MTMTKTSLQPSTVILSCLAAFALLSLAGCADNDSRSSTSNSSTATLSTDSKDMTHRSDQTAH
ncbi:MAG: hypothetical protein LV481_00145 [Methylacidiphilales bacterium]|nr:hypothetical protein [Candidatus Methylacidiphilales bacterium]